MHLFSNIGMANSKWLPTTVSRQRVDAQIWTHEYGVLSNVSTESYSTKYSRSTQIYAGSVFVRNTNGNRLAMDRDEYAIIRLFHDGKLLRHNLLSKMQSEIRSGWYTLLEHFLHSLSTHQAYPAARGEPKGAVVKYGMGIPLIFALVLIVWVPLLVFSLINRFGVVLNPKHVSMTVSVEGYPVQPFVILDDILDFSGDRLIHFRSSILASIHDRSERHRVDTIVTE